MRTREGIKGIRGLPKYLDLIDPVHGQYDILKAYVPYAEKQGLAHPVVALKDNSTTNRNQVKSDFAAQPQKDRLVIISAEDALDYMSPQQNAWEPYPILDWINAMIARATQMNKLMLEGDPAGYLSASETAISNWEASVKEDQVYKRTQFLPIWIALGASEDCDFADPSKPAFLSLMQGVLAIRQALFGLVRNEDIVRLMNERLDLEGKDKLRPLSEEEQVAQATVYRQITQREEEGGENESGADNQGNKTD